MKFAAIFTVIFSWVVLAIPLSATTIWVDDDNVAGPWDGSEANPYPFIQDGIDAAVGGDTVIVNDGTYKGNGNRDLDFNGKAITLQSENGPDVTIIDCEGNQENKHRGFYFHNSEGSESIVDGFTIRNGFFLSIDYNLYGGGIYCYESSPTIRGCVIKDNSADFGGGISCYGSSPIITSCIIKDNSAYAGGGIDCYKDCSPTIINCTITGNNDGGIYCEDGAATITNCTISGNSGGFSGGIGCYENSSPIISSCTITENSAYAGGGIGCLEDTSPTIMNCIIKGNTALDRGGGISLSSNVTITNCTITGNSAPDGGGIFCGSATITNCIITGNSAYDVGRL